MVEPNNSEFFNIYIDESCHLENDGMPVMAMGAIWCAKVETKRLNEALRDLKKKHKAQGELKWSKVSQARLPFYLELIDWFFAESALHYRGLLVENKQKLSHLNFNQGNHDVFYYKMQFTLLKKLLSPSSHYAIYLDVKDTHSRTKLKKLREVLCNNVYDFNGQMISHMQNIHSHESELMQMADFFTGALTYCHRNLTENSAKVAVIAHIETTWRKSLRHTSSLNERKLNIFLFQPQEVLQ